MQNKTKIMYIFNDNFFGGAAISLLDTLKEIKKEINPVVIMQEGVKIKDSFEALNIPCYEIRFSRDYMKRGNISIENKKIDFKQSYDAAMQLLPIIEKENIQLIHINSSVSYFAAIAALIADIPFIWHIRELMEEHFGCECINEDLKKILYFQADRIITVSDYVKQKFWANYSIPAQKIYDGIDIDKYKINIDKKRAYKNIFLVAGVISPEKGQWDAICAVENLIKKGYSGVRLIIVGADGGKYVWALNKYLYKKKLEENIKILSFQNDLSELRRQASYAISCSQNEALGRVTIEAMLAGNVLIGARSGGTIEIIGEDEDRGFLYELHNSEALAEAMIRAMQCPKEIKDQMAEKAQKYAEYTFDSNRYCKILVRIYSEVLLSYRQKKTKEFLYELKSHYNLVKNSIISKKQDIGIKQETVFSLTEKWNEMKKKGYNLTEYFKRNHFKSVAIYGMASLGCRLYDELEQGGIEIKYLLDKNPNGMEKIFKFASLNSERLIVDVIVVTVSTEEKQIIKKLQALGYENVIGLSNIFKEII